jgi:hypothetical protein
MKLNLSDVEVRDFDALPIGWYPMVITDWEPRESGEQAKNPGKFYLALEMTVESDDQYNNRKAWTNCTFLPNALFTLKGLATALDLESQIEAAAEGCSDEDYEDLCRAVGELLESGQLDVRIGRGKGEYKDRQDVKGFAPLGTKSKGAKKAVAASSSSGGSLLP